MFFNSRSLCNKLTELYALFDGQFINTKYDIIFVCETWLDSSYSDGHLLNNNSCNYSVVRCDRPTRGGGLCAFINNNLHYVPVALPCNFAHLEIICVDVMRACYKHRFIAVYRPPHYDLHCTGELMDCLNSLCDVAYGVTICGNFNLPNVNWKIGLDILNLRALEACLFTFIVDNGFSQLVHENTRHNNTLGLLLVNDLLAVANVAVTLPFSTSDHSAITWYAWFPPALPRQEATLYDFKRAAYSDLSAHLCCMDWIRLFSSTAPSDVDCLWLLFKRVLYDAIALFVPRRRLRRHLASNYPVYIQRALKRKHALFRRRHHAGGLAKYNMQVSRCKILIKRYHRTKERRLLQTNSLSAFYRHVNRKLCSGHRIAPVRQTDGSVLTDDASKAAAFNAYIVSVFTQASQNHGTPTHHPTFTSDTVSFTPDIVFKALSCAKNTLSSGPDAISSFVLVQSSSRCYISCIFVLLVVTLYCTPKIMNDDQNVHSQGSEPASSQSVPCSTCQMCKKAICAKSLAITIACIDCGGSCHVGCLVNNFVDTHGGALKTSLIWLTEFLRAGNFRFTCDSCSKLNKDASLATQSALLLKNRINAEIATLKQCIAAIDSKITSFLPCVNQRNSTHSADESDVSEPSAAVNQAKAQISSKSYAAAVGSDLPAIVKSVVAESFKAQRRSERDNASLVIYKLKETNNDLHRVKELFPDGIVQTPSCVCLD